MKNAEIMNKNPTFSSAFFAADEGKEWGSEQLFCVKKSFDLWAQNEAKSNFSLSANFQLRKQQKSHIWVKSSNR